MQISALFVLNVSSYVRRHSAADAPPRRCSAFSSPSSPPLQDWCYSTALCLPSFSSTKSLDLVLSAALKSKWRTMARARSASGAEAMPSRRMCAARHSRPRRKVNRNKSPNGRGCWVSERSSVEGVHICRTVCRMCTPPNHEQLATLWLWLLERPEEQFTRKYRGMTSIRPA